jgi:hypothetical protein
MEAVYNLSRSNVTPTLVPLTVVAVVLSCEPDVLHHSLNIHDQSYI